MNNRKLICIGCPKGCNLTVQLEANKVVSVTGNSCKVGEEYGKNECTNPTRILTTIIPVLHGDIEMLPCKTSKPIPKDIIFEVLNELSSITVIAPIYVGDIIIENILHTGSNIIATRQILQK